MESANSYCENDFVVKVFLASRNLKLIPGAKRVVPAADEIGVPRMLDIGGS